MEDEKNNERDRDTDKEKKPFVVPGDPPIIVGGGGSSLVWIRKDQVPQLIDPATLAGNQPTKPTTPSLYYCFRVKDNHATIETDDGTNPSTGRKPVNGRFHVTYFDDRQP